MRLGAVVGTAVLAMTSLTVGTDVLAGASESPPPAAPAAVIDAPVNGQEAITELGTDLPAVAASIGMAPAELKEELLSDPELWIDSTGMPMFVDTELGDHPEAADEPVVEAAPFPYGDTFTLHSNDGSDRTIYLDFDGMTVASTAWNTSYNSGASFTASAFDMDGDGATFSNAEKDVIQSVWQRIAEDFAAFDVDVTTEDPGAAAITRADANDTVYGTRLLITNTSTILSTCGCGGIAYVGVFDTPTSHAAYQPAFVFTRDNQSAKFIAEAGSHEVGHNLGLNHDGSSAGAYYSGHGTWAPIMGVGYSKPVSQWSKGEYKGATNKQDDVAVMSENGVTALTDDFGNTTIDAEFLGATFPADGEGVISHAKDVDVFKFNAGAGALSIVASPSDNSPNLDISLELLNSKGKAILKADPVAAATSSDVASGLDATITTTLTAAGTYYLRIDGTKNGNASTGYSDYGSIGPYTFEITGQAPSGLVNVVPVAKVTADKTVGVPGPITLTNTGSTDPDGEIASTAWAFGDSSSGTGASVSHTYSTPGTYEITMTVTDNSGGTATKTHKITAVPAMSVDTITAGKTTTAGKIVANSTVKIVDAADAPIEGAAVSVTYTYGTKKATGSGKTGADGTVLLKGPTAAAGTVVTATVTKVTFKGKAFNAGLSNANSSTITL